MSALPDDNSLPVAIAHLARLLSKFFGQEVHHFIAVWKAPDAEPLPLPPCDGQSPLRPTEDDLAVLRAVEEIGGEPKGQTIAKVAEAEYDENFRKRLSRLRKARLLGGDRNAVGYPLTEAGRRVLEDDAHDEHG